ncbi:MAG: hypothetical protein ABIR06_14690 [Cyclobacteriaceae bacterium]
MTTTGMAVIEKAKNNGAWTALDRIENLELPKDLKLALKKTPKQQLILKPLKGR